MLTGGGWLVVGSHGLRAGEAANGLVNGQGVCWFLVSYWFLGVE